MQRRNLARGGATGAAATVATSILAPAIAQSTPGLKWRLTSSFPRSLDSAGAYYVGKDPAFAIDTALPFATNARRREAWMRRSGGREPVAGGTRPSALPQAVMESAFAASNELHAELPARNALFKKIYDAWRLFRNEGILWFRVCEGSFDNFMARMSAAGEL